MRLASALGLPLIHKDGIKEMLGERHPGHLDQVLLEEFDPDALPDKHGILEIGGHTAQVDTTDFEAIDFEQLVENIKSVAGAYDDRASVL